MMMEPENLRETWEVTANRREWLRRYEADLRATASEIGWEYVAERLEAAGWSEHWSTPRRLTGEALAREMAQIAFRNRHRAGQGTADRRLVRAVSEVVAPLSEKIDALLLNGGITPGAAAEFKSEIAARKSELRETAGATPAPASAPRDRQITAPTPQTNLILAGEPVERAPVSKIDSADIFKKGDDR